MNRAGFRALSMVTLAALGITTLATALTGGCAYTGNGDPAASVCGQIGDYVQTCNVSRSCQSAFATSCSKVSTSLSSFAVNALFDCSGGRLTCGNATSALSSACFLKDFPFEFQTTAASAAQTQLAHDYCHACAPNQSICGQLLFLPAGDAGVPPGGGSIYAAGDSILEAIDSQCIPGLPVDAGLACEETFTRCAAPIVSAGIYLPPECIVGGYTATGDALGNAATTDAGASDAGASETAAPDAG